MLLSVCIITYNEEKFIRECIQSVKHIADEVIVVDSFSNDSTQKICESEGCIFYQYQWENNYSLARNRAIDKAKGRWILFLDADEELVHSEKLLKVIRNTYDESIGGFIMERTDIFRNKDSGKTYNYPIGIVRLFRNLKSIKYQSPIHEEVNSSIIEAGLELKVLTTSKIKHKVNQSSDDFLHQKQQKYLSLLEIELRKDAFNWWALYHKAKTLWFFDKKDEAKNGFLVVAQSQFAKTDIRISAYCNAAILANELDDKNVFDYLNAAEFLTKDSFITQLTKADILYRGGEYLAALRLYARIPVSLKSNKRGAAIPGGVYLRPEIKAYKIGCCLFALEHFFLSRMMFNLGNFFNPQDPINLFGRAVIDKRLGKITKAANGFNKCIKMEPNWKSPYIELNQMTANRIIV